MSLLLDALKKAAEQKAQKSQQEAPEQRSSDETLIRACADDVFGFDAGETGSARDDETELDHSEIRNRLESDLSQRIAGDETGFDIPGYHRYSVLFPATPEPVTGDDTGLDIADATGFRPDSAPSDRVAGDDTGLDIAEAVEIVDDSAVPEAGAGDETGSRYCGRYVEVAPMTSAVPEAGAGDETALDIAEAVEVADDSAPPGPGAGDDTGLDIPDVTESRAESAPPEHGADDETGLDIAEAAEAAEAASRSAAPDSGASDDTGLDIPDVTKSRLEPGHSVRADTDETGLDMADFTATRSPEPSEPMQIVDDEIIILADEDPTGFAEELTVEASAPEAGDETDIGQPAASADEIESVLLEQVSEPDETSADEQESDDEITLQADADEDLSLLLVDQTDSKVRHFVDRSRRRSDHHKVTRCC